MSKRAVTYVVYRHGSNAHNQPMCGVQAVGLWEAPNRSAAIESAEEELIVFANQHLTAKPAACVSKTDYLEAIEADAIRMQDAMRMHA